MQNRWKALSYPRIISKAILSYKKRINKCEECGKSNTRLEMHHKDGNPYNNKETNWQCLCAKCHRFKDRGKRKKHQYIYSFDNIKSITPLGKERMYDIQMEMPQETANFVANGFIVHNSFIKQRSPRYRPIYDIEKARQLELMKNKAENAPTRLGHADARARRKMVKHFLVDYYRVCKTLTGEEQAKPYVIEKMGHTHFDDVLIWIEQQKKAKINDG
jgi:hypothetical protein